MSYADIAGGNTRETIDVSRLPEELQALLPQLDDDIRAMIAQGKVRIEVSDGPEGKMILVIKDDVFDPEGALRELIANADRKDPWKVEHTRTRTKFDIEEVITPSIEPFRYDKPRTGRNEQCSCGSGRKYKRCCIRKIRT